MQTKHHAQAYERSLLAGRLSPPPDDQRVFRALTPTHVVGPKTPGEQFDRPLGDSGEMTLEDFAPFAEVREGLAYRSLRGERLSRRERSMLDTLNTILDGLLPQHAGLADDVRRAMAELERFSAVRADGDGRPR